MKQTQTEALLIKGVGGLYTVEAAGVLFHCRARGIFRKEKRPPLPGDRVLVQLNGQGDHTIEEILPRKNELLRPSAANIDRMFLVVSTTQPAPNLLLLDKMTAIAHIKGIQPIFIITKSDLSPPDALADIYTRAGFPVICTNPQVSDAVCAQISALLAGKISVFTGNTGVGKSTLLNRLMPKLDLDTGEISQKLGRGRHTTRHVELFPAAGGYVADTPGFSALELNETEPVLKEDLADAFADFAPYLGRCRFPDCAHVKDKGCAILGAVKKGEIAPSRHNSYCAMYESAKDLKEWELRKR